MRTLATLCLIVGFAWVASGQDAADRHEYERIDRQIFARYPEKMPVGFVFPSSEEQAASREVLRDIVTRTIQRTANANGATEEMVLQAISTVQIKQWWVPNPGEPGLPFVHFSELPGAPSMTTAFAVCSGGFAIPKVSAHIQFYSKRDGSWKLIAETGEDFNDRIFALAPLRSPVGGEAWYLAWGMVIGDTGARLKVHLYAFDGGSIRIVWSREALRGGSVKMGHDGSVTLTYFLYPPEGKLVPPTRITEQLRPTVRGLEP